MEYGIFLGTRQAGKVQLLREGLYVWIACYVRLQGDIMYRLAVEDRGKRLNLGVLAPSGQGYGLERRIPASRFPEGEPEFLLVPCHEPADSRFVPISPREPFAYLTELKDAYAKEKEGRMGILLPRQQEKQSEREL